MCRHDARAEVVDRDFHRRMAASLLPERIHSSGRRGPLNQAPWRNGSTLEKPGREGAVPDFDARRAGVARPVPQEVGGREVTTHTLDLQLLERPFGGLEAAWGGNGSAIVSGLPYLHQAMLAFGHPGGLQVT